MRVSDDFNELSTTGNRTTKRPHLNSWRMPDMGALLLSEK